MSSQPSPHAESPSGSIRPTPGRYFLRALLALSLIYYAVLLLDLLLHPLAIPVAVNGFSAHAAIAYRLVEAIVGTGVIVVGAFIMRRVPGNLIGPLMILYGVGDASYMTRVDLGSPLLTSIAHLLYDIYSGVTFPALFLLIVSFPSGQVFPRRAARWAALYVLLYVSASVIGIMAQHPGPPAISGGVSLPVNPLFIPALAPYDALLNGAFGIIFAFLGLAAAVVSLILRYRAAHTRERQQIKWFIWVTCVVLALLIFDVILSFFAPKNAVLDPPLVVAYLIFFYGLLNAFPAIGIGLAILRFRLWEIDLIINRTLVYGSLTALLALLYVGLIFGLQSLFQGVFHQNNDVTIVVSTLVIAALFQPLRHRVQQVIDRRFYRRKYDAARTLAQFSASLRNEVDLQQLSERLLTVVEETMQPAHVSLWLRKDEQHRKSHIEV